MIFQKQETVALGEHLQVLLSSLIFLEIHSEELNKNECDSIMYKSMLYILICLFLGICLHFFYFCDGIVSKKKCGLIVPQPLKKASRSINL